MKPIEKMWNEFEERTLHPALGDNARQLLKLSWYMSSWCLLGEFGKHILEDADDARAFVRECRAELKLFMESLKRDLEI